MTQSFYLGLPGWALSISSGLPMHNCPSPKGRQTTLPPSHTEHLTGLFPRQSRLQLVVDLAGGRGRTWKIYELG